MTTKELSEYFNCSTRTIQLKAKEIGIEMIPKKTKYWTKEEVSRLSKIFNNYESANFGVSKSDQRLDRLENMLEKIITILPQLLQPQQQVKQIEENLYTVKEYLKMSDLKITESQKIAIGKIAVSLTKKACGSLKYVEEDGFNGVGKYNLETLEIATSRILDQDKSLFNGIKE